MKVRHLITAAVLATLAFSAMAQKNPYLPGEAKEVTAAKIAYMEKAAVMAKNSAGQDCTAICMKAEGENGCKAMVAQHLCLPKMVQPAAIGRR